MRLKDIFLHFRVEQWKRPIDGCLRTVLLVLNSGFVAGKFELGNLKTKIDYIGSYRLYLQIYYTIVFNIWI